VTRFISRVKLQKTIAIATLVFAFAFAFGSGSYCLAQMAGDSASYADVPQAMMSERELENLVAPIALYPDALLSQVLVASTYPAEVEEAEQWLQQNGYLQGRELMVAAQQQNWDPSVQALVAFPDVVVRLSREIRWTTELGNAVLSQQADVMNAIQDLRAEARGRGRLASGPQLAVYTEAQGDRSAIEIQPVDPQRMYVPNYDPNAVWGAPAEGEYPAQNYAEGNGFGDLFGTVANLAGFLPGFGGLLGPRSWGWALGWLAQALFVNNSFFSDFGFHNGFHNDDGGFRGSSVWVHNEHHRLGVPYGNRFMAGGNGRGEGRGRDGDGWKNFGESRYSGAQPPRRVSYGSGMDGSRRGVFQRNDRTEHEGNWRSFNSERNGGRNAERNGGFNGNSWQSERGRQSFGNSSNLRRRVDTGSSYGGRSSARVEPSRTVSRSWEQAPRVSAARMSPERRYYSGSSYGSSRYGSSRGYSSGGSSSRRTSGHDYSSHDYSSRGSSGHHGFFSHSSGPKAPKMKAPKAPHYAKSHGGGHFGGGHSSGGHSSGGHGGKKSHRG